jgi:hypothetical protein
MSLYLSLQASFLYEAASHSAIARVSTVTLSIVLGTLTLLRGAVLRRELIASRIRNIGASVELLVTGSLKRSAEVHKRVLLDRERPSIYSRNGDGGGGDASESAGEGL